MDDDPVDLTVQLSPRMAEKLDAMVAVYETAHGEIMRQALVEHIEEMLTRRQTRKKIAHAYLDDEITTDELEMLFGPQAGVELVMHMKEAIEERDTHNAEDREG